MLPGLTSGSKSLGASLILQVPLGFTVDHSFQRCGVRKLTGSSGNVGQANYSAAKMGLISFTKTLAREGAKYNIKASAIAPMAASAMTETIMPPDMLAGLKVCGLELNI